MNSYYTVEYVIEKRGHFIKTFDHYPTQDDLAFLSYDQSILHATISHVVDGVKSHVLDILR